MSTVQGLIISVMLVCIKQQSKERSTSA